MDYSDLEFLRPRALQLGPLNSLVPRVEHPFFLVTPPYTRVSAGVTVLHLLCHYLNRLGESAYIVHNPPESTPIRSLPGYVSLQTQREFPGGMLTPLITQDVIDFYHERRLTPIVIYPEVFDNPFNARFFGRYILNYPGKLNAKYAQKENFSFAYTKVLAEHCTREYPDHPQLTDVLFVPTSDLDFWNTKGAAKKREGSCYYAGKMKDILGKTPENLPARSVEILRSQHMSREQVRELFWKSEVFYCYEDTALAIEAQLCGCPTVFVPNEHFTGLPLAFNELGADGSCRAGDPHGLDQAKRSVCNFEHTIRSSMALVPSRIAELAAKWKAIAAAQNYQGSISYPFVPRLVFFDRGPSAPVGFAPDEELWAIEMNAGKHRPFFTFTQRSWVLIRNTYRAEGVRGVVKRVFRGLRNHGVRGVVRLLHLPDQKN
ncbi:MAG: hypothetical protein ACYCZT_13515 [Thiobacillus sp.]